jgi:hypothetical protein
MNDRNPLKISLIAGTYFFSCPGAGAAAVSALAGGFADAGLAEGIGIPAGMG